MGLNWDWIIKAMAELSMDAARMAFGPSCACRTVLWLILQNHRISHSNASSPSAPAEMSYSRKMLWVSQEFTPANSGYPSGG